MVLGITGPTGAGKTTLLQLLSAKGYMVLDCDAVYHRLLRENQAMQQELTEQFGAVFSADGVLNRQKLGTIVFGNPEKLAILDAITRRYIRTELHQCLATVQSDTAIDAIKLIESGLADLCDYTIAVTAPKERRIARIMQRDGIEEDYARLRVEAQKTDEFYIQHCNMVLYNDFDTADAFALYAETQLKALQ